MEALAPQKLAILMCMRFAKLTSPLWMPWLQYKLEKADGSGIWTYPLGPRSAPLPMYNQRYRLPAGVSCERCVLQVHPKP